MNLLAPVTLTDAMLVSASIAEPAAGETVWVSAGTYAVGDVRIRVSTHRQYLCILAHTGRTTPPEGDLQYWEDIGPTARWAPFDSYTSTQATATTSLSYTLAPGFVDTLALYGLTGATATVEVRAGSGGALLFSGTYSLYQDANGLEEYLFGGARPRDKLVVSGLPLHPSAHITLTLSAAAGSPAGVGIIAAGRIKRLAPNTTQGGTQYGASVEPTTFSRISTDQFGNTTIRRGAAATGMRAEVVLPLSQATYALRSIQELLDLPIACIATEAAGYDGLNVFGLVTASQQYDTPSTVRLSINVKGLI